MIRIGRTIQISKNELAVKFSRSSGPGGQNVNKLSTRVTVCLDVAHCPSLSLSQRETILDKLAGRATKNGIITVTSQRHRTQQANRLAATQRLVELLQQALEKKRPRQITKPPAAADRRRLAQKSRRSSIKQQRSHKNLNDDL